MLSFYDDSKLHCSTDFTVTGNLSIRGKIINAETRELREQLERAQRAIRELNEKMDRLTQLLEECYIAPGMPGAPVEFSV